MNIVRIYVRTNKHSTYRYLGLEENVLVASINSQFSNSMSRGRARYSRASEKREVTKALPWQWTKITCVRKINLKQNFCQRL